MKYKTRLVGSNITVLHDSEKEAKTFLRGYFNEYYKERVKGKKIRYRKSGINSYSAMITEQRVIRGQIFHEAVTIAFLDIVTTNT